MNTSASAYFGGKCWQGVDQREQYSDQKTKKIQRPDTQDAPQVKEAQVEFSAQFLFAEPEFGNQVSAEQEEKVYSEPTGRSRARNQPAVADAARRKMGSVAAPARVKNEMAKKATKRRQSSSGDRNVRAGHLHRGGLPTLQGW
jgi:hypothetical protein